MFTEMIKDCQETGFPKVDLLLSCVVKLNFGTSIFLWLYMLMNHVKQLIVPDLLCVACMSIITHVKTVFLGILWLYGSNYPLKKAVHISWFIWLYVACKKTIEPGTYLIADVDKGKNQCSSPFSQFILLRGSLQSKTPQF